MCVGGHTNAQLHQTKQKKKTNTANNASTVELGSRWRPGNGRDNHTDTQRDDRPTIRQNTAAKTRRRKEKERERERDTHPPGGMSGNKQHREAAELCRVVSVPLHVSVQFVFVRKPRRRVSGVDAERRRRCCRGGRHRVVHMHLKVRRNTVRHFTVVFCESTAP